MADAASGSVDRSVQVKLVLLGKLSQLLTVTMNMIHTRCQFGLLRTNAYLQVRLL